MQYPNGTTFMITDGATLRLLRNTGDEQLLTLEELPAPQLHTHHGAAHGPHGHRGNTSPRSAAEEGFAIAAIDWLNAEAVSGRIGPVYIVAPPRTLGELRPRYHTALRSRLLGELGKEHAQDPLHKLRDLLATA